MNNTKIPKWLEILLIILVVRAIMKMVFEFIWVLFPKTTNNFVSKVNRMNNIFGRLIKFALKHSYR